MLCQRFGDERDIGVTALMEPCIIIRYLGCLDKVLPEHLCGLLPARTWKPIWHILQRRDQVHRPCAWDKSLSKFSHHLINKLHKRISIVYFCGIPISCLQYQFGRFAGARLVGSDLDDVEDGHLRFDMLFQILAVILISAP